MSLESRMAAVETQLEHVIENAQADRQTMLRNMERREVVESSIDGRLRSIERLVFIGVGGLMVLQVVLQFLPVGK